MRVRQPDCKGGFYWTDKSKGEHAPHDYYPREGPALLCAGWTSAQATAAAVIERVCAAPPGSVMEAHPELLADVRRLTDPEVTDKLFGVTLTASPVLRPGEFRFKGPFPEGADHAADP